MKNIAVALAVRNEEENLKRCLDSVHDWVDEIVVVDGGSTDGTVEVAARFGAKIIKTDNPPIFHINKQKALEACTARWILQLDADEIIPSDLKTEILTVVGKEHQDFVGFYVPRKNFFIDHWLKKGGQYPDYVIRLFLRGKGKFPCKSVHEQIEITGPVGYLDHPMLHYSYRTFAEYWRKADAYTSLTAREMAEAHISKSLGSAARFMIFKPLKTFLSLYLRHKGILDGWYGFLFAWNSGYHHAWAYRKYLQLKNN